ncbi:MAG: DUF6262 family protein [Actinomycetota bacterium]|jgi:hypothetical protein|nr:DUF6262 family protein [Actinomycetota bacterium]
MTDDPRTEVLRRAASAKRDAATGRAEAGLRKLIKTNAEINFRAVANAGGVSTDFLYRHAELRARIEHLRSRQSVKPLPASDTSEAVGATTNVVAALTAKLRQACSETADLKAQLAVAHGQLLILRRQLPGAAIDR